MPIITIQKPETEPEAKPENQAPVAETALLIGKDGKLTLAGMVAEAFLAGLDYSDLFEDAELKECFEVSETLVKIARNGDAIALSEEDVKRLDEKFKKGENPFKKKDDKDSDEEDDEEDGDEDETDESKKDDDEEDGDDDEDEEDEEEAKDECARVFAATVESISGELAAELIDEDDLGFMYLHYVHALPESTLIEKSVKSAAIQSLGLNEAEMKEWAMGDFVKVHKQGGAGKGKVSRMLIAMMHKQAIARAKPGQPKYKAKGAASSGTYTHKGTSGKPDKGYNDSGKVSYGAGSPKGISAYHRFIKGKKGKKTGDKASTIAAAAKSAKGGVTMKAAVKSGEAKKKAKANVLTKKKPGGTVKKKSLVAHDTAAVSDLAEGRKLHEGASIAGRMLGKVTNGRQGAVAKPAATIVEGAEEAAPKPAAAPKPSPFGGRATIIRSGSGA
jgi:hypothetical protein